jgi:NDP-sugar pyrophosphorylase family protein
MVEVCGRPFLEFIIQHLAQQEFRKIVLLVGYLGEKVQRHFEDGSRFGVSIEYSWESSPLGTGGAIRQAWDKLHREFLLLYGDSFLPINYVDLAKAFRLRSLPGLLVMYDNRMGDSHVLNNIAVDAADCVTRYEKGSAATDLRYVDAGAVCLSREVFADVPAETVVSLEEHLFPKLIAARQMGGFQTKQRFYDIGTPLRLEEFAAFQSCSSLARHSG